MINHKELLFEESLPIGEKREKLIKHLFGSVVDEVTLNKDGRYDLLIKKGDKEITVEVKFDDRYHETGNFAVECESWGKPSGIETTESQYWIFVDHYNNAHCIETEKLKELCKLKPKISTGCLDSKNKIYLVRRYEFDKHRISLLNIMN